MDLNRIAVFARVVSEGSFTKAARALSLPKSSVSRSVSLLEKELGTRLLLRSTRKVQPTEAGAAYFEQVARALAGIEEASAAAAESQATPSGTVRMTSVADLGTRVLMPIVTRFVRKHPTIKIELSLTQRIVDLVEEGFDLALRAGPLRESSLVARRVGVLAAALYASPKYVARRGVPRALADLPAHDCVIFRPIRGAATWTLQGPDHESSTTVTGPVMVDEMNAVRRAVLLGAGIGLLPAFLCAREIERGQLVRVLPDYTAPGGQLHLLYPSARLVPQRVVLFRDHLLRGLAKVPWSCTGRHDQKIS
ncbi:MAG: LysR family transcriptional regulator [Deltaproteobacteria bacterium]|nr:LysR family transcriptional regulator [Deltaproteobacteria bacterium]